MSSLVLFHKQLGDGVLLEPALRAIAEASGSPVALHGAPVLQTLVELMPHVKWEPKPRRCREVWVFETGSRPAWEAFRLRAEVKRLRVRKITHVRWFHRWVFRNIEVREHRNIHNALFFLRGVDPHAEFVAPHLEKPPESWRHAELPSAPFIAVNLSASLESKAWEAQKWNVALRALAARFPLVVVGAGPEWVDRHVTEAISGVTVLNLTNRTSLKQFLHATSAACLHLSVEGAGAHLAMALGVPAAAIFSRGNAANPLNWYAQAPQRRILIDPGAKWAAHGEPLATAEDLLRCAEDLLGNL